MVRFFLYGSLAAIIGAQFFTAFPEATRNVFALLPLPRALSCGRSARWSSARWVIWSDANTPS
ncbi:hypothetical protein QWZ10_18730 [Paracoccus cavernae]|uniref:Uncharacterized protein n=1 Tax=Paracoccus cavernae TaxID=1571207 RepID=A0ABT8D9U7_9RHOB|nr:hypothetical protein [Paracoccus cavernae]